MFKIYKRYENTITYSKAPVSFCKDVSEVAVYLMQEYYSDNFTRYRIDNTDSITFINRIEDLEYFENHEELIRKRIK